MTMVFIGTCMLISKLLIRKSQLLNELLLGGRTSDMLTIVVFRGILVPYEFI